MKMYSPFVMGLAEIPVRKLTVIVDGVETFYWDYGPADKTIDIVMVHGFRGDHHGLESIVSQLGPHLRVIVPDLPGFGLSAELYPQNNMDAFATWLKNFWQVVGATTQTCLLGHSFGSIVVSAAIADGLDVNRVVLVNPIAANALTGPRRFLTKIAVGYYRLSAGLPEPIGNWLLRNQAIVRAMSVAMAKTRDKQLRRWIHAQHKMYFSVFSSRRSLLESFQASVSHDVTHYSSDLKQDVLLIVADQDDITALPQQQELAERLSHSRIKVVTDVGHLVHYEAPDQAARWIRQFLAETETGTHI